MRRNTLATSEDPASVDRSVARATLVVLMVRRRFGGVCGVTRGTGTALSFVGVAVGATRTGGGRRLSFGVDADLSLTDALGARVSVD